MNTLPENKPLCRKLSTIAALLGAALYTACFVFARLEVIVTSDVLMADSGLAKLLSLLQTLTIILGFALFYSFTAFLIKNINFKKTLPFIFAVVGITLYRSLLSLGGRYFIDGMVDYDFFMFALPTQVLSFALELAQYLLILLVAWLSLRKAPLNTSLLYISLTVMILNIGSRILYDVGYGAPTSNREVIQMVLAYASDILLYGVLLLLAMRLLASWANKISQRL